MPNVRLLIGSYFINMSLETNQSARSTPDADIREDNYWIHALLISVSGAILIF